jgi:aspartyl protease family protein
MALSSTGRMIALQAIGWLGAGLIGVVVFFNLGAIRELSHGSFGLPRAADALAKSRAQAAPQGRVGQTSQNKARAASSGSMVELQAGTNGHFHADAEINGRSIGVMVDSGASLVALSYDHAQSLGIFVKDSDFTMRSNTANGVIAIAPVMIERVTIGNITVRNVQAAVSARGVDLGEPLLGMSFLSRLKKVEMNDGRMILQE